MHDICIRSKRIKIEISQVQFCQATRPYLKNVIDFFLIQIILSSEYQYYRMGLCSKTKQSRPPLQPREGPYKKVNAYTMKPSIQQIFTLALALLVVVLHSIFEVAAIRAIDNPVLYIMLALNYILVVALIYIYIRITIFDPVDTYLLNPRLAQTDSRTKTVVQCTLCQSLVHEKSYHCKRCNRCTEDFDHHCVYLNSCIGSLNYEIFIILLLLYILFLLNNIGQSIWVFVRAYKVQEVRHAAITEWMAIVILIICSLQLIATGALLGFHCYISCCLDLTTIAFYQSDTDSKKQSERQSSASKSSSGERISVQESPAQLAGPGGHDMGASQNNLND